MMDIMGDIVMDSMMDIRDIIAIFYQYTLVI